MSKKVIKGEVTVSPEEQELALSLLREVAYDNGFFNRWNPEKYNAKWINKVGPIAKVFFDKNPEVLTDENIEEICCGEESWVESKFMSLEGFKELSEVLDEYFENS